MYPINVSNFNNNSGLYALALVTSLAIEEKEIKIGNIPTFVSRVSYADVAPIEQPTDEQKCLGVLLRIDLSIALKENRVFKDKAFAAFINLCLHIHKRLPVEMETFAKSNDVFIADLKSKIQKIYFDKNVVYKLNDIQIDEPTYVYMEVRKNWDAIYNKYINYITDSDVMLSADELNCLALTWGIKLPRFKKGDKVNEDLFKPDFSFAISNESGSWEVLAKDSTIKPVSIAEDDQFKTLCLLDELLRETLTEAPSSLDPSESGNVDAFRNTHMTFITKTRELVLKPKNVWASMSFNGVVESKQFQEVESIKKDLNTTLWSFKHPQKLYNTSGKNIDFGLRTMAALEVGSAAAGFFGVSETIFFTRAFQAGRAIRLGEAVNVGATILSASNIAILVSALTLEMVMLARSKYNEFGDVVRQALKLYQESLKETNNIAKLSQIDQMLRSELGIGTSNRWRVTRSVIWAQAKSTEKLWKDSDDQYALIYYILADIGPKLDKDDMQEFFNIAYSSSDKKIKALSLLGLTKLLANTDSDSADAMANTALSSDIKKNMDSLKIINPQLVAACFNDVQNALAYSLWIMKTQTVDTALSNIEKILKNDDLKVLKYMQPHGELCVAVLVFIQGICCELKDRVVCNKNLKIFQVQAKEKKSLYDLKEEFYKGAIEKFKNCCAVMLNIEQNLDNTDKRKSMLIQQMRGYCRRFFNDGFLNGKTKEEPAAIITKFNLAEQNESEDSDDDMRELQEFKRSVLKNN